MRSLDDEKWVQRSQTLAPWLTRLALHRGGKKIKSRAALHVYIRLMTAHRWCWVRGVRF